MIGINRLPLLGRVCQLFGKIFGGTYKMEEFNLAKNAQIFAIAEDLIQWH